MSLKIHNCEQYSDEWWSIRDLKLTASKAQAIATAGKGLETYIYEIISDHLSTAPREQLDNEHIQRGNELEDEARTIYEMESGDVEEVGIITNSSISDYVAASPDGLIEGKKGLEIKCMMDSKHVKNIIEYPNVKIETAHMWQMQMQMLVGEYDETDYVLYNPNFDDALLIIPVKKDKEKQEKLLAGIQK